MKNVYYLIIIVVSIACPRPLFSQMCDPGTPVTSVNLSGNPMAVWLSSPVKRYGLCCTASSPDVCVEFIVTLDPAAIGITFNIASGAIPPGALYYQVNCGPPVQVGYPICLNGAGPHHLTFCKPGNNQNTYSIASFTNPVILTDINNTASPQCSALLTAQVANVSTISWTSIPYNALYNSFLSCTTDCDTVVITPSGTFPPYIDYVCCGTGIGNCANPATACDTVRAYLHTDITVSVSPSNITLCNGVTTTAVTASTSGGSGIYQYLWSNGQATSTIIAGAGTYHVTVTDTATCHPALASSIINVLPPIVANAGPDVTVCANKPAVHLNGMLQTATAAIWNGGTGSFNPNNASLNAIYTPSASEIANGYVNLILETTANQGCPPGYDTLHIAIVQPPAPSISGNLVACINSTTAYSVPLTAGCSYVWNVIGGTINGSSASNSINVTWGSTGSGTVSVTVSSYGCSSSDSKTISLVVLPNPIVNGINSACQYTSATYSVSPSPGSTYSWSVTNGSISGSSSSSSINVNWNSYGSSTVTITETNSYGCITSATMPVMINQQPVPEISGNAIVCAGIGTSTYTSPFMNNTTYSWSVTGGTVVSSNGSNTIEVDWNSGGGNSVTLTVSNAAGCDSTMVLPVTVGFLAPLSVQANTYNGCPPLSVSFSGNAPAPGQTYAWSFGDQLFSASANPTHIYDASGTYNLTVITQSGGCRDSATAIINVYNVPQAQFDHNFESTSYYIGESTLQLTNTTVGGNSYLWTFGTRDTSNVFEPNYSYDEPGTYLIQLFSFSDAGCPDTAWKEIRVRNHELTHIPNSFTPNGDNVNDYFRMLTIHIARAEVVILDRWGQKLFESDEIDFMWDGKFRGRPVELGVYIYKIKAWGESGKEYNLIGPVTLFR